MSDAPPPPPGWDQPPPPPPPSGFEAYPPPPPPAADADVYAPWWKRLVAAIIDGLLIGVPIGVLGALLGLVEVVRDSEGDFLRYTAEPTLTLLSLLATLAYSAIMEGGEGGATVGKMALRIRVRDVTTGGAIGMGRALLRRFVYVALFYALVLPGLINGLSPLWDARKQAWHDKAANSVVVNSG